MKPVVTSHWMDAGHWFVEGYNEGVVLYVGTDPETGSKDDATQVIVNRDRVVFVYPPGSHRANPGRTLS